MSKKKERVVAIICFIVIFFMSFVSYSNSPGFASIIQGIAALLGLISQIILINKEEA